MGRPPILGFGMPTPSGTISAAGRPITVVGIGSSPIYGTPEEKVLWNDERLNDTRGFKSQYDDFILFTATDWRDNPEGVPITGDKKWPGVSTLRTDEGPPRTWGTGIMNAAFVYFLTGDTSYSDVVRAELLAQVNPGAIPGTDWTNLSFWGTNQGVQNQHQDIAAWIVRHAHAYEWVKDLFSTAEQTTIEQWFLEYANYSMGTFDRNMQGSWSGWKDEDFTCDGTHCPGIFRDSTHSTQTEAGNQVAFFHRRLTNIPAGAWAGLMYIAYLLDGSPLVSTPTRLEGFTAAALKPLNKIILEAYVKYALFEGSVNVDSYRWSTGTTPPNVYNMWGYGHTGISSIAAGCDVAARRGDPSYYTFTSEEGGFGSESLGAPKGMEQALEIQARRVLEHKTSGHADGVKHYASSVPTSDASLLASPINPASDTGSVDKVLMHNTFLSLPNVFYQNSIIQEAYNYDPSVDHGFPLAEGGSNWESGPWGLHPGYRFMFANLEGLVNPYP